MITLSTIEKIKQQLPDIYKKLGISEPLQRGTAIKTVKFRCTNGFVGRKIQVHIMPYIDGYVCTFFMSGQLEKVRWRLHPRNKVPGFDLHLS
jgi:hypothetical protein